MLALDSLPLGRVVNDKKVEDHHALIPTQAEHNLSKMGPDELKVYDLVAKRFLAVFHPDAVYERTRIETVVAEHVFRTSGRRLLEAGWKAVYGAEVQQQDAGEDDTGGDQLLPKLEQGEQVDVASVESIRKETQPPRRFTEASLLGAMETAGKDVEDAELREAMKESGIGTPATRASIIERLVDVGYIEREGRALHATDKGVMVIRLLGQHPLTSPELTGDWERRLALIEQGEDSRPAFMRDIAGSPRETVQELDKLKDVKIERANLGPCPVCGRDVIENRKGYSCWSREDPGCGFVIWKRKAGKILPPQVVKELMATLKASIERGDEPPRRPHREAGARLQGPLRPHLPRQAQDRARRRRQVARRVRRGVGEGAAPRAAAGRTARTRRPPPPRPRPLRLSGLEPALAGNRRHRVGDDRIRRGQGPLGPRRGRALPRRQRRRVPADGRRPEGRAAARLLRGVRGRPRAAARPRQRRGHAT